MTGWPEGFFGGSQFDRFSLVVLRLLPKRPDTLLLRLLGRGVTFRDAVRELSRTPQHAWAVALLEPVLVAFRTEIAQTALEEEDMDTLSEIDALYAQWEQRVKEEGREEGREKGREEGLIKGIETLCSGFGIELSDERCKQLASWDIPRLEQVMAEIVASRHWPDAAKPS